MYTWGLDRSHYGTLMYTTKHFAYQVSLILNIFRYNFRYMKSFNDDYDQRR